MKSDASYSFNPTRIPPSGQLNSRIILHDNAPSLQPTAGTHDRAQGRIQKCLMEEAQNCPYTYD